MHYHQVLFTLVGASILFALPARAAKPAYALDNSDGVKNAKVYTDVKAADKRATVGNVELPEGTLFETATPPLPLGEYRLTLRAKMSALGSINTAPLSFSLHLGGATPIRIPPTRGSRPAEAEFPFDITVFERAQTYQDISFPVRISEAGPVTIRFVWRRVGLTGIDGNSRGVNMQMDEAYKRQIPSTPDLMSQEVGGGLDDLLELEEEPEISTCKHLFLAVDSVTLTPVTLLPIEELSVDKIRYKPGEKATIALAVANGEQAMQSVSIETVLLCGLDTEIPLDERVIAIPPKERKAWTVQSPPLTRNWGYAVRTRVKAGERILSERSEYFTVHSNHWAVLIAGKCPQSTATITPEAATMTALQNKYAYANWCEPLFWAPDEFGDFTPDEELWWGGQGCIAGSISGTKALIQEGHNRGISFSLYSNIWGGDGPPAFEMVRRFPETARPSSFNTHWFDNWKLNSSPPTMHVWPRTIIRYNDESWAVHAKELIDSYRQFGWDSVRYDSHAHSQDNADAISKVRNIVNAEIPDYQFGYNTSTPGFNKKEYAPFAVHCRNGNLIMEEAIGQPGFKGKSYKEYAERILIMKQETRSQGGHFLAISDGGFPDDWIYTAIFWLAGNTHPCYAWPRLPTGHYLQFATRYAGFIWDLKAQEVEAPSDWVSFMQGADTLWLPERYMTLRKLEEGRAQLIVHLINAPVNTHLMAKPTCALPEPRENIALQLHPPGYRVVKAWSMTAEPEIIQTELPLRRNENGIEVTSPRLRFWNMLVFDLQQEEVE